MATTFARLCQQVDITQKHLEEEIARFSKEIDQLEEIQNNSKLLRYLKHFFPYYEYLLVSLPKYNYVISSDYIKNLAFWWLEL